MLRCNYYLQSPPQKKKATVYRFQKRLAKSAALPYLWHTAMSMVTGCPPMDLRARVDSCVLAIMEDIDAKCQGEIKIPISIGDEISCFMTALSIVDLPMLSSLSLSLALSGLFNSDV